MDAPHTAFTAPPLQAEPSAVPLPCSHVYGTGRPCGRRAAEGDDRCILHAASVVHAQDVIFRRLLALQEKSLFILEELFDFGDDKTKLAAVQMVLDRTGLGPTSTLRIEDEVAPMLALTDAEILARIETAALQFRDANALLSTTQRMDEGMTPTSLGEHPTAH